MHKLTNDRRAWGQWTFLVGVFLAGMSLIIWSLTNLSSAPPGADARRGSPGYGIFLDHYHHLADFAMGGIIGAILVVIPVIFALSGLISTGRER